MKKQEMNEINEEAFRSWFGERLKMIRIEKGWKQKDVAFELCVSPSTYANWEQGRREPSIYNIYGLLAIFEITPDVLFPEDFTAP